MNYYTSDACGTITADSESLRTIAFLLLAHNYVVSRSGITLYVSSCGRADLERVLRMLSWEYNGSFEYFPADGIGLERFKNVEMAYWNDTKRNHSPIIQYGYGCQLLQNLAKKYTISIEGM